MLTLLALFAAFLGPGLVLADNSGGGPVKAPVAAVGKVPASTVPTTDVSGDVPAITVTVDDNSGGGPVRK